MAKEMTIEEAKQKKLELEKMIANSMKEFEKDTGMRLGYIDVLRKRDNKKEEANSPESVMPTEYKTRDIETVNIDLRLDD